MSDEFVWMLFMTNTEFWFLPSAVPLDSSSDASEGGSEGAGVGRGMMNCPSAWEGKKNKSPLESDLKVS